MKTPTIKKGALGIVLFVAFIILFFVANTAFLLHIAFPKGADKSMPPPAAIITPTWVFIVLLLLLVGMVFKKTRKAVKFIVCLGFILGMSGSFVVSLIPFREPADIQKLSCAAQLLLSYESIVVFLVAAFTVKLVAALTAKKSRNEDKDPPIIETGQR